MKSMRTKAVGARKKVTERTWLFPLLLMLGVLKLAATTTVFAQVCTPPPPGMVSWYSGDGNAEDIAGSHDAFPRNGVTFAPGMVAQAFSFDGVNDFVEVPDSPDLAPSSLTVDAWVKPTSGEPRDGTIVAKYNSSIPNGVSWGLFMLSTGQLRFLVDQNAR